MTRKAGDRTVHASLPRPEPQPIPGVVVSLLPRPLYPQPDGTPLARNEQQHLLADRIMGGPATHHAGRRWGLLFDARPWSLNGERKRGWWGSADAIVHWRREAGLLARKAGIPHLDQIVVASYPLYDKGPLPDTGNTYPAVKAAIDGLLPPLKPKPGTKHGFTHDTSRWHVIADDDPKHVLTIVLHAPVHAPANGMLIVITELTPIPREPPCASP